MLKFWVGILAAVSIAACAPMPPAPGSQAAPRIEGTPGKAVIYVVRTRPDVSYLSAPLVLDDQMVGVTHAGTYLRLETTGGRHRLSGYAQDNGAITLDVQPGQVYFIQHSVSGSWRATNPHSFFTVMSEARARAAMARTVPAAG